jgi:hypothetical protein
MPILSTFFGIIVRIFHGDHNPPHIHVEYAEDEAIIEIKSGRMLDGKLPPRAKKLIEEWRKMHVKDLEKAWTDASANKMPTRIAPLK